MKIECDRCGECCYYQHLGDAMVMGKFVKSSYIRHPCKELCWDEDDTPYCGIYEDRPDRCRKFYCKEQGCDTILLDALRAERPCSTD